MQLSDAVDCYQNGALQKGVNSARRCQPGQRWLVATAARRGELQRAALTLQHMLTPWQYVQAVNCQEVVNCTACAYVVCIHGQRGAIGSSNVPRTWFSKPNKVTYYCTVCAAVVCWWWVWMHWKRQCHKDLALQAKTSYVDANHGVNSRKEWTPWALRALCTFADRPGQTPKRSTADRWRTARSAPMLSASEVVSVEALGGPISQGV